MDDLGLDAEQAAIVFQAMPMPMTLLGRRGDGTVEILAVNPAGAATTGWDPVTVRGRTLQELYPGDHAARTAGFVAQVDAPGAVVDYSVGAEGPSGRRAYEVRLVGLGERDGTFLVASVSTDVTRRDAAESALEETQRLARVGHFSWNLETGELTWTDQMYELFGLEVGTPIDVDDVFAVVEEPEAFQAHVDEAIATVGSYETEFRFTRADGERRVGMARGRAVVGRDGTAVRVAGTTQDVTEQRAAEAQAMSLARARSRQAQALELNDDVLQGLATVRIALMQEEQDVALASVDRTLEAARAIISDLLRDHLDTGPIPGDLVRARSTGQAGT